MLTIQARDGTSPRTSPIQAGLVEETPPTVKVGVYEIPLEEFLELAAYVRANGRATVV